MSTLKVNKIRDTSGSADAITLDPSGGAVLAGVTTMTTARVGAGVTISESGIEASGIGITCANINGTQIGGRRNKIINGDARIAQRATSATSVSGQYKTVDRFSTAFGGADESPTESQHSLSTSDTPYALGFRKSFHYTNGNQTSGAGSSDYLQPQYKIEAQDLASCGWDYTSSTSFITLSFWVKSSVAGDYTLNFGTHDGTAYRYLMEYTLVADTWKHVVFKIPGNSNLTINDDNGHGATIMWYPFLGSAYVQADQENNWYASSNGKYGTVSTTNWWTTNDSTWEITGVQLEVGEQATAFEHRMHGEELLLCQRYYQQLVVSDGNAGIGILRASSSNNFQQLAGIPQIVKMRTGATGAVVSSNSTITCRRLNGSSSDITASLSFMGGSSDHARVSFRFTGDTPGQFVNTEPYACWDEQHGGIVVEQDAEL